MVLTGRAALEASGAVSAEDEIAIGGFERIMGPNGEAQYFAQRPRRRLPRSSTSTTATPTSCPARRGPRPFATHAIRSSARSATSPATTSEEGFPTVGEIFDDASNPGRKRPFAMRAVMERADRPGRRPPRALAPTGAAPRRRSSGTRTWAACPSA